MGHDIKIIDDGNVIDTTHISGNFSRFIHKLHGHSGKVIAGYLRRKLDSLRKRGIEPNYNLGVDGSGQYTNDSPLLQFAKKRENGFMAWKDYEDGIKKVVYAIQCMHAYHMERFLQLALKYPYAYWYSDQVWEIQILDGDMGKPQNESDDESDDGYVIPMDKAQLLEGLYGLKKGDGVVYQYNHPIMGIKTIQTWKDAMEAARIAVENDDELAVSWTMMALFIKQNT